MTTVLLIAALLIFVADILFYIEVLVCRILDILYASFEVFSGIEPVIYQDNQSYLIDVFFSNDLVTTVYWGMACIGFALTFAFAVVAVVKKVFDSSGEKVKATYGMILTNIFKAILLILLMTALVSATINATCILMQQIDYLFNNAEELNDPSSITFDDTDFANMFNIMNTIGNYSLNPSYNNRFNINSCYNSIRPYMIYLKQQRTFDFSYEGAEESWQYALLQIYNATDIEYPVDIDAYNETLQNSIMDIMYKINTAQDFKPLKYYQRSYGYTGLGGQLGRVMMISGSFDAAKNGAYNKNPSITDPLRRPYYLGSKDIYDKGTVEDDFDIGLKDWNHLVVLIAGYFLIKEFAIILFNCVARMFNIILLYIMAPPFIAVLPLDDGGKLKQWTTAFVIQSLSIFGSVVAVRLLMIFIPIVLSSDLILFKNGTYDFISKLFLVLGICVTSEKANGLIGGILADNAGYQSIMAGDVGGGMVSKGLSVAGSLGKGAAKLGFKGLSAVGSGVDSLTGAKTLGNKISEGFKNFGQSLVDKGGLKGAAKSGFTTNAQDKEKADKAEKEADKRDTKEFRNSVLQMLGGGQDKGAGKGNNQEADKNKNNINNNNNNNTPTNTGTGQNSTTSGNSTIPTPPPTKNNSNNDTTAGGKSNTGDNNPSGNFGGMQAKTPPIKNHGAKS